jgi:hypothetical protein
MATAKNFNTRLSELISLADQTLATETRNNYGSFISEQLFAQFKTASLSFILNLYGKDHPYYMEFAAAVKKAGSYEVKTGKGILASIKTELDGEWLITMKGIISAELFSDFLEMAEHLLSERYKDAAAVIIGTVLEEHLRQLCIKNGLAIEDEDSKTGKSIPKKAESLNTQLRNGSVYDIMDQKNVTAWFALRNKAAHGQYAGYTQEQVELQLQSIRDFITRNKI